MPDSAQIPAEGGSLAPRAFGPDYKIDPVTGCWLWLKTFNPAGYGTGSFTSLGIDTNYAHRAYYEVAHGPLPEGHDVHHKCKNQGCVNPAHLAALTEREHDIEHFLGEKAGLTVADVLEIRRRGRILGVQAEDVAAEFGIFWSTVNNYWSGDRRWADLLGDDPGPAVPLDPCAMCGGHVERGPSGGPSGKRGKRTKLYCSAACCQRAYVQRRKTRA